MHVSVAMVFDIVPTPGTVWGLRCVTHPDYGLWGVFLGASSQQFQYTFHTIFNCTLNVLTIKKIWGERDQRQKLSQSSAVRKIPIGELKVTFSMIFLSLMDTIVYIPCAISWPIFDYFAVVEIKTQAEFDWLSHSSNISHTFLLLTGANRCLNFFALLTMPSFFQTLFCMTRKAKQ